MFVGPSSPSQSFHGQKELGNRSKPILIGQFCHPQASKGIGSASPQSQPGKCLELEAQKAITGAGFKREYCCGAVRRPGKLACFGWLRPKAGTSQSAGTRNLANETSKNATTKFPLAYVEKQLVHSLYQCSGHPKLNWRPRKLPRFFQAHESICLTSALIEPA